MICNRKNIKSILFCLPPYIGPFQAESAPAVHDPFRARRQTWRALDLGRDFPHLEVFRVFHTLNHVTAGQPSTLLGVDAFRSDESNSSQYFCVWYPVVPLWNKEDPVLESRSQDNCRLGYRVCGAGSHLHHSHFFGSRFPCARLNRRLILSLLNLKYQLVFLSKPFSV